MPTTTISGQTVHINDEGFLTDPQEWTEDLAKDLAALIGIELGDKHWEVIHFLRSDFEKTGETATLRRISTAGGIPIKSLFTLFPKKPAKKLAYVSGLPKPQGCV